MPHVFYSANLAAAHQVIWQDAAKTKSRFGRSMATWERKLYGIGGEQVEGNLESATAELQEKLATRYPDAVYLGEGEVVGTIPMGERPRSLR
jgi:hypothetical protein